ncbi:MAG: hypothetical protein ACLUOF_08740 [Ruminococcus sp.]
MKLKKLLAAVTTGVLAVTSLSLSGLVSSAEVQELMNDTFSGYARGRRELFLSRPQSSPTAAAHLCTAMTGRQAGAHLAAH